MEHRTAGQGQPSKEVSCSGDKDMLAGLGSDRSPSPRNGCVSGPGKKGTPCRPMNSGVAVSRKGSRLPVGDSPSTIHDTSEGPVKALRDTVGYV